MYSFRAFPISTDQGKPDQAVRSQTAAPYRVRPSRGAYPAPPFLSKGAMQPALTGVRMQRDFMNENPNDGSSGANRERRAAQKQVLQRQIEQLENRLKQVNQRDQKEARKRDTQM